MQSEFQRGGARLNIKLISKGEVETFLAGVESQGAVLIQVPSMLKQYQDLIIQVGGDFSNGVVMAVEVLSAFEVQGSFSAALHLKSLDDAKRWELKRHLNGLSFVSEQLVDNVVVRGAHAHRSDISASDQQLSPVYRIKEMDVSERFRLSTTANRAERAILLRDRSAQVLMGLLSHPRLSDQELLQLIRSAHVTPNLLQRIAKEKKWTSQKGVPFALVRNAKTPPPVAVSLMSKLKWDQLRVIGKMMGLREQVRRAALKRLTKR